MEIQRLEGLPLENANLKEHLDKMKQMNNEMREKIRKFSVLESRLQSLNHDLLLLGENEAFLKNKVSSLISNLQDRDSLISELNEDLLEQTKS